MRTLVPASHGDRMPRSKRLQFSSAKLCKQDVMTILTNSQHALDHLSFHLSSLAQGSTWQDLLTQISKEFSELMSFDLKFLSQGVLGREKVRFSIGWTIASPNDIGRAFWKGRPDFRWVSGISHQGPEGSHVLGGAAACIVVRRG